MSWLDKAKSFLNDRKADIAKLMGAKTIDGVGAALAMVGMADGSIDPREEESIIAEIGSSDALKQWSPEIAAAFEKHVAKLKQGTMAARAEVNKAVQGIPKNSVAAEVTVATCIAVGGADNNFDPDEQAKTKLIASQLGVDLSQYSDLFTA